MRYLVKWNSIHPGPWCFIKTQNYIRQHRTKGLKVKWTYSHTVQPSANNARQKKVQGKRECKQSKQCTTGQIHTIAQTSIQSVWFLGHISRHVQVGTMAISVSKTRAVCIGRFNLFLIAPASKDLFSRGWQSETQRRKYTLWNIHIHVDMA